ncbi:MAG: AgmX/PglI C-terminal domain-containing protein [Polyangiaceae bacterium]|nr:AgmX/PglI C-terminal domain-containing protein [Polyangiaceae bacterium]
MSLHVLVLLAGARLGLRQPAELPAEPPPAPGELVVDVHRAPPQGDEHRPGEEPAGAGAGPRGTAHHGGGREPRPHGAPASPAPGPPEEQAGAQARFDGEPAFHVPVALPGERSGALAALALAFHRRPVVPPSIPDLRAAEAGGDSRGHGAGAPSSASGGGGAGAAGGKGGAGGKSTRGPGGRGWGDSWDYVVGPHGREIERPASLLDSGARTGEVTLPRGMIHAVVSRSAGRLRSCHESGRRRDPSLAGRILVRFSVDPRGSVLVAANAGSTVADPVVIRCVLATFAAMTFPAQPAAGAAQGAYLIAFPPGE